MGGGISLDKINFDQELSEEEVQSLFGSHFDKEKFDAYKSESTGKLNPYKLSKIWVPHPGIGKTLDTYEVDYIVNPDDLYDEYLKFSLQLWCKSFWGHPDFGNVMWGGEKTAMLMCKTMFGSWPRGNDAGMLLDKPLYDQMPLEKRGISKEWLTAAWNWISKYMWWTPQTRVWIECFVKPITFETGCSLYDLIPLEYRSPPDCFLSHSWDLAVHCIFKAASTSEDWKATSYWIDGFAICQHFYGDDIGKIGQTVQDIGNTVVILRGEGPARENLRCMYRSWCIYEICHTPQEALKCAITAQNGDHEEYSKAIKDVDISQATATFMEDKEKIDQLVIEKFGNFDIPNSLVRKAIATGYIQFFSNGNGFGEVGDPAAMQIGKSFAEHYYGNIE